VGSGEIAKRLSQNDEAKCAEEAEEGDSVEKEEGVATTPRHKHHLSSRPVIRPSNSRTAVTSKTAPLIWRSISRQEQNKG